MTGYDAEPETMHDPVTSEADANSGGQHAGRVLVIPAAGWGNLGDAAMLDGTLGTLRALGFAGVDLANDAPDEPDGLPFDRFIGGQTWFYKGDRAAHDDLLGRLEAYAQVVLIGADCIDGSYSPNSIIRRIDLVADFIRGGGQGRILGASFKDDADPRCVAALQRFPADGQIFARDPFSQRRMEQALKREIMPSADLAFLCRAEPDHRIALPVLRWIAQQRRGGRRVVALNINSAIARKDAGFALAHRDIVAGLVARDIAVLLAPNDVRHDENDDHFLSMVSVPYAGDAPDLFARIPSVHPGATKAVFGAVDMVVTSRMHPAILAAGAGRPSLSLVYQGKFEGLYQLLGLAESGFLRSPAELMDNPRAMVDRIVSSLDAANAHADTIGRNLPNIMDLAGRNFAGMEGC